MPCPDLGALRASLDDPTGTPAPPHDHVPGCASCADTLAELQRNAELAAPAIALTAPADPPSPAAVEDALTRFEQRRARLAAAATTTAPALADVPGPIPRPGRGRVARLGARARGVAAGLVAALVLAGLLVTPGGRAAAAGFLAQFRSQRFEVVSLDPGQSSQVADVVGGLVQTGVFTGDALHLSGFGEPEVVAGLDEAARVAGFAVSAVDPAALPAGVERTPQRVLVTRARETRLTFDRDRALAYLRGHGRPDARLPERYDGTQLVVQVPAAVVQQFAGRDGVPALLVGKAGTVGLATEGGASLEELREVLLGLPGLPAETVAQLRAIGDWRTTLPLPVPSDQVRSRPATVDGAEAISFADQTGRLHALLWQRGGHIWGVAGVVGSDEALDVANSLG
ncbi:MAG TPA: hypothetical protein VG499_07610 [Actinomycetota bacterium]|nr:hypothetical protein [Actinomycetota bacterium]